MTLDEVWKIVSALRPFRLEREVCVALADTLAGLTQDQTATSIMGQDARTRAGAAVPLVVQEELVELLRPAYVPPPRGPQGEEVQEAADIRADVDALFQRALSEDISGCADAHVPHGARMSGTLTSAVQYRAKKYGLHYRLTRERGGTRVSLYR